MATDQKRKFCKHCQEHRLFLRSRTSEIIGLVLTFITLGLYFPIWIGTSIWDTLKPFRCSQCGGKS